MSQVFSSVVECQLTCKSPRFNPHCCQKKCLNYITVFVLTAVYLQNALSTVVIFPAVLQSNSKEVKEWQQ
jgi:hypothetical protein